jgi:hypothetical protein
LKRIPSNSNQFWRSHLKLFGEFEGLVSAAFKAKFEFSLHHAMLDVERILKIAVSPSLHAETEPGFIFGRGKMCLDTKSG